MKDGFIRVAAATPKIKVADPEYNAQQIIELINQGYGRGVKLMVFPELCLTAYTCSDLFFQSSLLVKAREELARIISATKDRDILVFVGLPWEREDKLFNVAAVIQGGKLLGIVPKKHLPNYAEFYEARHFCPGNERPVFVAWEDGQVPMGTNLLFRCSNMKGLAVGVEICEDVWIPAPPSIRHALAGATVIVNCSASDETTGKDVYRHELICSQSARLVCGYVYANAGDGESTQDLVFGGQNLITENGTCLAESKRFANETIFADMDMERLNNERRRLSTYPVLNTGSYVTVGFHITEEEYDLERPIDPMPFVPTDEGQRNRRCEEILSIQAMGLKKRLAHTGCSHAVIGISGGLDSTLALLVTVRAFDMLNIPRHQIHAVTMPCFGTTDRTYQNACLMTKKVGAELTEIDIREAVTVHFRDIGHDISHHDVTYENSQARERTQILMDTANQEGGLVVGTGDLSEMALGWCTYNGDHMSMYGVNASVPKTLVRFVVKWVMENKLSGPSEDPDFSSDNALLKETLQDILDTPISPELLPPDPNGDIAQKTEESVGPYILHDFFIYYTIRYGMEPEKLLFTAKNAFAGEYDEAFIKKWMTTFYRRFFAQQFKRSCVPDGPKVGSVSLSPRGDWRMPSDADAAIWLDEIK